MTFDSDAPNSKRLSFIGSDNYDLGVQLANVLLQVDPTGYKYGKYALITSTGRNFEQRLAGFRKEINGLDAYDLPWEELTVSPLNCLDREDLALKYMYQYASNPRVRAIITLGKSQIQKYHTLNLMIL